MLQTAVFMSCFVHDSFRPYRDPDLAAFLERFAANSGPSPGSVSPYGEAFSDRTLDDVNHDSTSRTDGVSSHHFSGDTSAPSGAPQGLAAVDRVNLGRPPCLAPRRVWFEA